MKKKHLLYPIAGLMIFTTLAFGNPSDKYFEILRNLDIFATLYKEVNRFYVDEISPTDLMETGINAMLKSLDPYTNYIPEDKIEDYRTMTLGEYSGIGASVSTRNGKAIIMMPFEGFAAHRAGLRIGDKILKINGLDMINKNSDQLSRHLKGQSGTEVSLLIERYGKPKPFEVKLSREKITINNVPYYGMISEDVGMIKLTDFTQNAGKEVRDALIELKEKGAKNIVLDLRGNPGGLLREAINVSNVFVKKGSEIVSTKGKVKEWNKIYQAPNAPVDTQIPVVVLVNGGSASAAEIVAGVIQDYDRGVLIGENSYGKGLVQATRSLSYNSKVKVTVAKYYIPSGRCIQSIDYTHRNSDGSAGKMPDSLRTAFKTRNGRTVYDGAGVKPDIEPKHAHLAKITLSLETKNLIFDYATKYREEHEKIKLAKNFTLSDNEYVQFVKWLQDKDFDYTTEVESTIQKLEETAKKEKYYEAVKTQIIALKRQVSHNKNSDLQKFKSEIRELLEKEIAARYYLEKGKTEAEFDSDPDILEALKLFKETQRYRKILGMK